MADDSDKVVVTAIRATDSVMHAFSIFLFYFRYPLLFCSARIILVILYNINSYKSTQESEILYCHYPFLYLCGFSPIVLIVTSRFVNIFL